MTTRHMEIHWKNKEERVSLTKDQVIRMYCLGLAIATGSYPIEEQHLELSEQLKILGFEDHIPQYKQD